MLDVRPTLYVAPLDEQTIGPLVPVIHVENLADEDANITGLARIYRESLGTLLYTSVLHPGSLNHGQSADFSAETEFNPGAIADDDYFILAEITARSTLTGNSETVQLGQFYFDIKTAPMGPVPATHHTTHENGGMDEISVAGLSGILGDIQPVDTHATSHQAGESDALELTNLGTAEMDDTLVLAPDGAGGVEFRAVAGNSSIIIENDFLKFDLPLPFALSNMGPDITTLNIPSTPNHLGVWRLTSGDNSAYAGAAVLLDSRTIIIAGTETTDLILQILQISPTLLRFGLHNTTDDSEPTDGIYIEITDGLAEGKSANDSTRSTTPSSFNISASTWYRLIVSANLNATTATFTILSDTGTTLWTDTLSTNIPVTPGREVSCGFVLTGTGPSDLAEFDYISISITRPLVR